MKKIQVSILTLGLAVMAGNGWSQQPVVAPPIPTSDQASTAPILSPADLGTLVGPIALYPDPMISLILPASTVPTDIVLAARYLENNGDPNQIDAQNWDPSVKGLARYPDVINMMNENLDWTNQLGAAVIAQQADVMNAIQAEREKAQALGNLQSTPQQNVVTEQNVIQIIPADPEIIYVPTYDPAVVYVQAAPPLSPFITFGAGLALGAWIGGGCDWYHHGIYTNGYWGPHGWGGNNVNINNNININNGNINNWHPNNNRPKPRPPYNPNRPGNGNGQLPGFKPKPPGGWNPDNNRPGNGGNNRPGNGGNNRPGNGGNTPGNRPGNGGNNRPGGGGNSPALKPGGGGNTPGNGGNNRPGGGGDKPALKPGGGGNTPGNKPGSGANKPALKPGSGGNTPTTRPGGGSGAQRPTTRPAGGNTSKGSTDDRRGPATQNLRPPSGGGGNFRGNASKPAQPAAKPSRPGPQGGGGGGRPAGGGGRPQR